jgi:ABC-2 type transport system permease protein
MTIFIHPSISLLRQLVLRDLRLRYRATTLGFLWSLAKPGALILLFYIIFQMILRIWGGVSDFPRASYGAFVAIGIITWSYFSGAIVEGVLSYTTHQHLITKASFWRPVLPLSCAVSHWFHYLFAQIVLIGFFGIIGYHSWNADLIYLLPLSLLELALAAGIVWMLAWFQVVARDTLQFVELGLMVWFYGSPIIYPASVPLTSDKLLELFTPDHVSLIYLANPIAPILIIRQRLLMSNMATATTGLNPTPGQLQDSLMIAIFLICGLLYVTWRLNRRVNHQIADRL